MSNQGFQKSCAQDLMRIRILDTSWKNVGGGDKEFLSLISKQELFVCFESEMYFFFNNFGL